MRHTPPPPAAPTNCTSVALAQGPARCGGCPKPGLIPARCCTDLALAPMQDEEGLGEEGGSSEEEGGEGESGEEDEEDAEHAEARHAAMLAAIRGAGAGSEGRQRKGARRRREVVVNEAYPESEYNLGESWMTNGFQ